MSRRRARRKPRGPASGVLLLVIALVGVGLVFSRLFPRSLRSRSRRGTTAPTSTSSRRPAHSTGRRGSLVGRLYFARVVNGQPRLTPVSRDLPAEAPARAALEELIQGEVPVGCQRPLPRGVVLRGVAAKDGLVTADFSEELVSHFSGGSESEGVVVYAVVNTLCSLPGVREVRILVEGRPTDTIGGHLDTSGPLAADDELVVS